MIDRDGYYHYLRPAKRGWSHRWESARRFLAELVVFVGIISAILFVFIAASLRG